ncbi:MAG: hypothetical protein V8S77_06270 [Oscillospiraceae bacterium]
MKRKHYVELNRQEWRLALNGLNRFRNKLIAAGRYADAVDEPKIAAATVSDSCSLACYTFDLTLTTVVPMAAPPLTNNRAIHKARLLVSPVCGLLWMFGLVLEAFSERSSIALIFPRTQH